MQQTSPYFPRREKATCTYFSLNFWVSCDPEVTVHQISAELCPFLFPINPSHSLHPEHRIIQESVYLLCLITCHGRMMPLLAELLFLLDTTTGDSFSNRPYHGKMCLWTYVDREGPDQPAHPHSLIRVFTVPSRKHAYVMLTPLNPTFI